LAQSSRSQLHSHATRFLNYKMKYILFAMCLFISSSALRMNNWNNKGKANGTANMAHETKEDVTPECMHDRDRTLENVKRGSGSIWIYHTTHHAGTYLRITAEKNGWKDAGSTGRKNGCALGEADLQDHQFFYDGVCGEHGMYGVTNLGKSFPCSSDKFFKITSMRHPVLRILAQNNTSLDDCGTDNYGLRKLIGKPFGEPITKADVELAKARLSAFDIVLDVEHLHTGIPALCEKLGWTENCKNEWGNHQDADAKHKAKLAALKNDQPLVYQKWVNRNAPEMEVYEHAKKLAERQGLYRSPVVASYASHAPMEGLEDFYETKAKTSWICSGKTTDGFASE